MTCNEQTFPKAVLATNAQIKIRLLMQNK